MTEVAVVTGAARGIGLATTKRFVNQGMKVAMIDRDADVLLEEAKQPLLGSDSRLGGIVVGR